MESRRKTSEMNKGQEKRLKWHGCVKSRDRARAKKNVRCTSTRKETERKTENQMERLV